MPIIDNRITRRQFIKGSTIYIVGGGAILATGKVVAYPPGIELPNPYPELPDQKPEIPPFNKQALFFNERQYALVATLAALIIPTDDDPGATEAGAVDYIDGLVAESNKKQAIYVEGLRWLDKVSQRRFDSGNDFLSLSLKEQIDLLRLIEETRSMRRRPVSSFWQRLDRKIDKIWDDFFGLGKIPRFFEELISDTMSGYYYNPISWRAVGYHGPPQPVGYLDFAEPPSSNDYRGSAKYVNNKSCLNCHGEGKHPRGGIIKHTCTACHRPHYPWPYDKSAFHLENHLKVIFPNPDRTRQGNQND